MTWKECSVIDERLRFVAGLLDGKAMTDVCRASGIAQRHADLTRARSGKVDIL